MTSPGRGEQGAGSESQDGGSPPGRRHGDLGQTESSRHRPVPDPGWSWETESTPVRAFYTFK